MRIADRVARYPGITPVYGEGRGPVLDLECEIGGGFALYLSPRELADALATKGVLDWERVRKALEAKGWLPPEKVAAAVEDFGGKTDLLAAELERVRAERDQLLAAMQLVKQTETAPKRAAKKE